MKALLAGRIRVVDGLVVALSALLLLKVVGFLLAPSPDAGGPDGLPSFARVLAHARTNYVPPDPSTTGSVPPKSAATPPLPAAGTESGPPRPAGAERGSPSSERAIQERLAERREELQQRARELEARERLAEEVERRLDGRAEDLRRGDAKPADSAASAAEDAEAVALKGLVTMYETMKPKEAARVFERLPQDVLVAVVRRIAPRKMAEIMAAMSPDTAEKLTVALARRGRGPEEARATGASGLPLGELPAIEPAPVRAPPPRAR